MLDLKLRYVPDTAIAAGEVLAELLEEGGMTQAELAQRTGLPEELVSGIVRGTSPVTGEVALRLEDVLQMPASLWLRLEAAWAQGEKGIRS